MTCSQPVKILCSFHYFRKRDLAEYHQAADGRIMIMGDSGAFSAASTGAPIAYGDYARWCRRWADLLFCYPSLDIIRDSEATWANHRRMLRDGLAPLPVYHYGSPLRPLQRYLDAGERYIALGGMVGTHGTQVKRWIVRCFQLAAPYGAVFHGFGRTALTDLADFPWYSVDSSTYTAVSRYGRIQLFDGHRFRSLERSKPRSVYRHGALLRAHGVTPAQMDNRNPRDRDLSMRVGAAAWRRCEEWMRRRHGPIPGTRPGDPPGPHLFLAASNDRDVTPVIQLTNDHPAST